jgi:hypothetical protein
MSDNLLSDVIGSLKKRKAIRHIKRQQSTIMNIEPSNDGYLIVPEHQLIKCGEKECQQYDIYNNEIYKKKFSTYLKIKEKLEKNSLELKELPHEPPQPNNFERLIIHKKRNQNVNCLEQTCAIIYLLQNGYKLVKKVDDIPINPTEPRRFFEAYQAIQYATELASIKQESFMTVLNYSGNYNFLRDINIEPTAPLYSPYTENISRLSNISVRMQCENPEHHSTTDKINFYDRSNC